MRFIAAVLIPRIAAPESEGIQYQRPKETGNYVQSYFATCANPPCPAPVVIDVTRACPPCVPSARVQCQPCYTQAQLTSSCTNPPCQLQQPSCTGPACQPVATVTQSACYGTACQETQVSPCYGSACARGVALPTITSYASPCTSVGCYQQQANPCMGTPCYQPQVAQYNPYPYQYQNSYYPSGGYSGYPNYQYSNCEGLACRMPKKRLFR
jgi:hypothetical protein